MKNQMNPKARRVKRGPESQEMPVNDAPSNVSADQLGIAILIGSQLLAACTLGIGTYYAVTSINSAVKHPPIDWLHCVLMPCSHCCEFLSRTQPCLSWNDRHHRSGFSHGWLEDS